MIDQLEVKLHKLQANLTPEFGIMSPQHMIEHLILTLKLSYGRIKIPEFEPSEKHLSYKEKLLYQLDEFPIGIRAPGLSAETLPLRFKSLDEAKIELVTSQERYTTFFKESPDKKTMHPKFGPMSKAEWDVFHKKHFVHHFKQFNIA